MLLSMAGLAFRSAVLVIRVGESSGAGSLARARSCVFFLLKLSGQSLVVSNVCLVGIGVVAVQFGFVVAGCCSWITARRIGWRGTVGYFTGRVNWFSGFVPLRLLCVDVHEEPFAVLVLSKSMNAL